MRRALSFAIAAVVLFGCTGTDNTQQPDQVQGVQGGVTYGGVFKLNEVEDFRHLYPHTVTDAVSWRIVSQVYEGLVKLDQSKIDNLLPGLAEKWEVNDNATKFTFYLRQGVTFHDDPCFTDGKGRAFTAEDVKYCFTKLCEYNADNQMFWLFKDRVIGANEYYASTQTGTPLAEGVAGIKVLDQHTIEIELSTPFAGFLKLLATPGGYIFPKEAYDHYGVDMRVKGVGTGPFKLKRVNEGDVVVLERNDSYWASDEYGNKLPYLNAIKITFQKEKKTELMQFRSENLHMVYKLPVENINEVLGDFEEAGTGGNTPFQMQSTPSMSLQYYGFLHAKGPFADKRVRQAFSMAVDREELVTYILRGEGIPAIHGFVPPSFPSYPINSVEGYDFDPQAAADLLAEAGYPGGAGLDGVTLQLNSGGTTNEKVAVALTKMFEDHLGVKVNMEVMPMNQHYERVETGQTEFWRAGWLADYPDPETFLNPFNSRHVPDELTDKAYLNPFRYRSATFDSLYYAAMEEVDDQKRMEIMAAADQQMISDAAVMPIYYEEIIRLLNNRVENFPVNAMEFRDFSRVYFREESGTE